MGSDEHRFGMWLCFGCLSEGKHKVIVQREKEEKLLLWTGMCLMALCELVDLSTSNIIDCVCVVVNWWNQPLSTLLESI